MKPSTLTRKCAKLITNQILKTILPFVFLFSSFQSVFAEDGWQVKLQRACDTYQTNCFHIAEQHEIRLQGFAVTLATALTIAGGKFLATTSAAQVKLNGEEAACHALTVPAAITPCVVAAQEVYWAAYFAASWQLGIETTAALSAYAIACEISANTARDQVAQQIDIWFINAGGCGCPPGILPLREWIVVGEEPDPVQWVDGFWNGF